MALEDGKTTVRPGKQLSPEAQARQAKAKALKAQDDSITLVIEDQPGKPTAADGIAEQPETKKKVSYYKKRKMREKQSAEGAAAVLIMLLDSMVGSTFGIECKMNEHERGMILEPLERILGRLDYATTQAVEKWTDPILLSMGMVAWIGRIARIQSEKRDDDEGNDDDGFIHPVKPSDDGKKEPVEVPVHKQDNVGSFTNRTVAEILDADKGISVS